MIKIYNTLTRQLEEFTTLEPNVVSFYNCGPTVNGLMHLGHARSAIAFDVIRRYLEYRGYTVNYVMNFTDIEDRVIEVSKQEKRGVLELTEEYLRYFRRDMRSLNIKPATINPRAMLHINPMIDFAIKLIEKGFAYESHGDVYFDVQKFDHYGKLSNQKLANILLNTEDAGNPNKHHPADFALWKAKKLGEPSWPSPWGEGRPGWHLECSVMSMTYLGESIDIHSGGQDLIFPHHENEIAQSESLFGKPFARYWLHNGYINIEQEKMSKSLGNFVNIFDLLKYYSSDAVRLFILQTHYRSPISFNEDSIKQAQTTSNRLFDVVLLTKNFADGSNELNKDALNDTDVNLFTKIEKARQDFITAMNEDFNTPNGLAVVFNYSRDVNDYIRNTEEINGTLMRESEKLFDEFMSVLGLFEDINQYHSIGTVEKLVNLLIDIRQEFRKDKNWAMSDKIRDVLKEADITLEDTPKRVLWKLTEQNK